MCVCVCTLVRICTGVAGAPEGQKKKSLKMEYPRARVRVDYKQLVVVDGYGTLVSWKSSKCYKF